MPKSETYTQNINRSKLQLKTIFKPKKEKNDTPTENAPKNPITPKIQKEVFTRVQQHQPKIQPPNIQPPKNTMDDIQEKRTLIWKIQKYQNSKRFGPFVKHNIHINQTEHQLNKLNIIELKDILSKIRIQLDNRNLDEFYNALIHGGCNMMETVLSPYYNIDGYGKNLMSNNQFMDSLERHKIEHPFPAVSSGIQLSYAMISTLIMTHELNKRVFDTPKIAKEVPPPVVEMEQPKMEELPDDVQKELQNDFLDMLKKSLENVSETSQEESLNVAEEGDDEEPSEESEELSIHTADSDDEKAETLEVVSVGAKM